MSCAVCYFHHPCGTILCSTPLRRGSSGLSSSYTQLSFPVLSHSCPSWPQCVPSKQMLPNPCPKIYFRGAQASIQSKWTDIPLKCPVANALTENTMKLLASFQLKGCNKSSPFYDLPLGKGYSQTQAPSIFTECLFCIRHCARYKHTQLLSWQNWPTPGKWQTQLHAQGCSKNLPRALWGELCQRQDW